MEAIRTQSFYGELREARLLAKLGQNPTAIYLLRVQLNGGRETSPQPLQRLDDRAHADERRLEEVRADRAHDASKNERSLQ